MFIGKISPLPRPVEMKRGSIVSYGEVIDEVKIIERYPGDRDYIDLIQYIEWENGVHSIRICYYVKSHDAGEDEWNFSNRPISIGIDKLNELMKLASKKKWFKPVLSGI